MLGPIGTPELVIILVVVLLIFGVGRISGIGRELGSSIKEFRRAVKTDDEENSDASQNVQRTQAEPQQQAPVARQPEQPQQQASSDTASKEPQKNIF